MGHFSWTFTLRRCENQIFQQRRFTINIDCYDFATSVASASNYVDEKPGCNQFHSLLIIQHYETFASTVSHPLSIMYSSFSLILSFIQYDLYFTIVGTRFSLLFGTEILSAIQNKQTERNGKRLMSKMVYCIRTFQNSVVIF